jgi:hypothetical protein
MSFRRGKIYVLICGNEINCGGHYEVGDQLFCLAENRMCEIVKIIE